MDFYMGNSITEVDEKNSNVEFDDELIAYVYKVDKQVVFDMHRLYEINPYDDVEISIDDLPQIIEICKYILNEELLHGYEESEEGQQMLQGLVEIAQEAIAKNLGLVSIGD